MESGTRIEPMTHPRSPGPRPVAPAAAGRRAADEAFEGRFAALFGSHHQRIYRMLVRLSGDPELADDLAQETFVRLYRRGASPDRPEAWLITVSLNLFRNARAKRARRGALLTPARGERSLSDPPGSPDAGVEAAETARRVRAALDGLPERQRLLLLLHAEGYAYRDIADALDLGETSVGALLARARTALRRSYQEAPDAPR